MNSGRNKRKREEQTMQRGIFVCLFVLRFYGPVKEMGLSERGVFT